MILPHDPEQHGQGTTPRDSEHLGPKSPMAHRVRTQSGRPPPDLGLRVAALHPVFVVGGGGRTKAFESGARACRVITPRETAPRARDMPQCRGLSARNNQFCVPSTWIPKATRIADHRVDVPSSAMCAGSAASCITRMRDGPYSRERSNAFRLPLSDEPYAGSATTSSRSARAPRVTVYASVRADCRRRVRRSIVFP